MNISQQLRQRQEQKLSPQQLVYLKLLQLPSLSLEQSIKQELELNPLLEEAEEEITEQSEIQDSETEQPTEEESVQEEDADDDFSADDLLDDDTKSSETWGSEEQRDEIPIEEHTSLSNKLREQLHLLELSEDEYSLCDEILGNLDADGYFRQELSEVVLSLQLSLTKEEAETVLKRIQHLEPPGIAARNLRECLLAQLYVRNFEPRKKELALNIVGNAFEDYVNKRFEKVTEKLSISLEELKEADKLIQKLNPKPGEGNATDEQLVVVPDFIIKQDNDELLVEPTKEYSPTVRINKRYLELLARKDSGLQKEERDFIRQRLEAAKTFIQCIQQRQTTLLDVMKAIVIKQKDFFATGEHLKPLTNIQIAELVGLDDSTVSRAVQGKYVQTQHGIFPLKHFFSSKVQQANGEEISNKEAKLKIKKLIEQENKSHPLADDEIAKLVTEQGLPLARRTVAKYRESLGIPIARLRRQI